MTAPTTIAPIQPPPDDPFPYGWRYVRRSEPEDSPEFDQVPLTLEDVLHPEESDFIVRGEALTAETAARADAERGANEAEERLRELEEELRRLRGAS